MLCQSVTKETSSNLIAEAHFYTDRNVCIFAQWLYVPMSNRSGISSVGTWKLWLTVNGFLLAALGVVGVFSFVVTVLMGCHLYLISINSTTWEFMSRHRISYLRSCNDEENPFDRGIVCNLWDFFCICRTVVWEQVYYRGNHNHV